MYQFPAELKHAKVTPLHKAGKEKDDFNNYRPITVFNICCCQLFERLIYNQFYSYLVTNNLLSKHQSGFRQHQLTVTSLLDATTEWLHNMDEGRLNSLVFIYLSKAFDTVDHSILLEKLNYYSATDNTLTWFQLYLSDRNRQFQVSGQLSSSKPLHCGVPQRSILASLLFLIYINDLPAELP